MCLSGFIFKLLPVFPPSQREKHGAVFTPSSPSQQPAASPAPWGTDNPPAQPHPAEMSLFLKTKEKKIRFLQFSHVVCISFVPSCSHFSLQRVPPASAAHCWLSVWFCSVEAAGKLSSTCPGRISGLHF